MSDEEPEHPWMLEPDTSEQDFEVIEDADESQEVRLVGDVPGFKETEDLQTIRHQAEVAGAAVVHYAVTGLLVAAALAVGVWALLDPPALGRPPTRSETPSIVDRARTDTSRTRLEWALETYRIETNDYPEALSALVDRGLLRSRDLYYPLEGSRWHYRKTTDGFRLEASQADETET